MPLPRGALFERRAACMLRRAGLGILARNYRARPGEIDIIAVDNGYLVFVEVRARSHRGYAGAAASVDARKQRRIVATAQCFLQTHPRYANMPCRFDVIAFEPRQSATDSRVNWIRGAFRA